MFGPQLKHEIELSYDIVRQCYWAACEGKGHIRIEDRVVCQNKDLFDFLCGMGEKVESTDINPPHYLVEYSDTIWDNLLSIGELA